MGRLYSILVLLLLSACGGEPNSRFRSSVVTGIPNGKWAPDAPAHALEGAWRGECQGAGEASTRLEVRVFNDRTLVLYYYYFDRRCALPNFEQVVHIGTVPESTEAGEWTLLVDSVTIRDVLIAPTAHATVRKMSYDKSCGGSQWRVNQARSVYGTDCFRRDTVVGKYRIWLEPNRAGIWIRLGDAPRSYLQSRL